jgi:hypothetical protein
VGSVAPSTSAAADLIPEDEDFADSQTPVAPSPAVLHEVAPDVPPQALKTVRGHIKFALRLRIDRSGEVVHASLASRSPSRYFTRIAVQTARRWQFVTADDPKPRHCLVWFDFTRRGAVAYSDLMKMRYVQLD